MKNTLLRSLQQKCCSKFTAKTLLLQPAADFQVVQLEHTYMNNKHVKAHRSKVCLWFFLNEGTGEKIHCPLLGGKNTNKQFLFLSGWMLKSKTKNVNPFLFINSHVIEESYSTREFCERDKHEKACS